MIVNQSKKGWHIVHQATHGLLAGKIAQQLAVDLRPTFWLETLTAIIEHDDHQLHFDEKQYLNDAGMPIDFIKNEVADEKVLERAKRIYNKAKLKSKLTALFVGMHLNFLYSAVELKEMQTYLENIETEGKQIRSCYELSKEEVVHGYNLLQFCDRCSLILSKETIPTAGRSLEINTSIKDKTYFIRKTDSGNLAIEPWPFENDTFKIKSEILVVEQAKFKNNQDLKEALNTAETQLKEWTFSKH